ncbi:DUF87 domain-containing protein [Actinokineospora sp. PR83]|uniref:ATP-binding protein n=1 Tax=Actinokineospora sp. PR83 TaxID=2884908 RepID=UPI0027E18D92|nr:DUF87 domain-containing protein [Actinokineospora sp. PR83]MCG8917346.1 DUF87 domain-containing protein [Actinokineospora sp. PR83]
MNGAERAALAALQVNWSPTREDVWQPLRTHVDGLNDLVANTVLSAFDAAHRDSGGGGQVGVVMVGQNGAGKTHMIRWLRERVQRAGGYFVLVHLQQKKDFWQNIVSSVLDDLRKCSATGKYPLFELVDRLAWHVCVPDGVVGRIVEAPTPDPAALDEFVHALRRADRRLGAECRHILRALLLFAAADPVAQDEGEAFLTSTVLPGAELSPWGALPEPPPPDAVLRGLSSLMAVTGPILLAVDQIDSIIDGSDPGADGAVGVERGELAGQLGGGLMELREVMPRTVTVVSCLPRSWELIRANGVHSVEDRFHVAPRLDRIPSAEVGRALVAAHFAPRFEVLPDFTPPYPTWPVVPEAFAEAPRFTPRGLLQRIHRHVKACQAIDRFVPLADLGDATPTAPVEPAPPPPAGAAEVAALDTRFAALVTDADVTAALDGRTENVEMTALLGMGLEFWVDEQDTDRQSYSVDGSTGSKPALHARLRKTIDVETEDQVHWSFRSIAATQANAVLARLNRAWDVGGLDPAVPKRKVYLLKPGTWRTGPVTEARIAEFTKAGGVVLPVDVGDLRVFAALGALRKLNPPGLHAWTRLRRPAGNTALLRAVFGDPAPGSEPAPPPTPEPEPLPEPGSAEFGWPSHDPDGSRDHPGLAPEPDPGSEVAPAQGRAARSGDRSGPGDQPGPGEQPGLAGAGDIGGGAGPGGEAAAQAAGDSAAVLSVGTAIETGESVDLPLEALRKHAVVFAGSGSGKTVLLRRLIEECALRGVSSIVLDPNNDLARLGDAWPTPPEGWGPGDAARAEDYLANTDVVVWTPRRSLGRPLTFQPLPDFAAVLDDADEFALALDTAVSALAPRARVDGGTAKAERGRAVLREALSHFAENGGFGLKAFLTLLGDLPEDVTSLNKATGMAADMADTLTAEMINDSMFGGSGTALDPGVLLTPPPGKRARVSVISFIGLPTNEQRQGFVNQLQMALFAWIKRNPAGDRPLGGLFVMDEAQTLAPSGRMTACTESTIALAAQARKYGLGLVFATQAPRGIHNRIAGNAATQFYGFLNSPTQIEVAKEYARAKASGVLDISRLGAGQFYAAGEGTAFRKLATPLCLSHHPKSALTAEEVLARAAADRED